MKIKAKLVVGWGSLLLLTTKIKKKYLRNLKCEKLKKMKKKIISKIFKKYLPSTKTLKKNKVTLLFALHLCFVLKKISD